MSVSRPPKGGQAARGERRRVEEATWGALAQVGRELAASLDVAQASDCVAATVLRIFRVRRSALFQLDAGAATLRCVAVAGVGEAEKWLGQTLQAGTGVAGRAIVERAPVWTPDVLIDPRITLPAWLAERARDEECRSVVAAPLVARGEAFGSLVLADAVGRAFTREELRLLSAFADQAALAVDNARQYRDAQERAQRLTTLSTLTRLITSASDSWQVFHAVAEAASTLLGAKMARVWVDDPASRALRVRGSFSTDPRLALPPADLTELAYGQGVVGATFASRTAEYILDIQQEPRRISQQLASQADLHGFAALPLITEGRALGVLTIGFGDRAPFSREEQALMGLLADQAAIAIHKVRLYEETERRGRAAESVAELGRLLAQSLNPEEVGRRIAESVVALVGVESSGLYRLDVDSGDLVALAFSGRRGPGFDRSLVLPAGTGVTGVAVRERRPIVTPDLLSDPRVTLTPEARGRVEQAGYRAVLAVPLVAQDRVIGALSLTDRAGRVFEAEDIRLAQTFADQAALALENARLYQESERRGQRLATLVEVARRLTRGLDLPTVLNSIAEAAAMVFEGEAGFRLLDGDFLVRTGATAGALGAMERERIRIGESLSGRVAANGEPLIAPDTAADERLIPEHRAAMQPERTGAMMCVPVRLGSRILGTLNIYRERGHRFDAQALRLATSLADQAAIAVENAHLYEETQGRLARLQRVAQLSHLVTSSLDLQRVLDFTTEAALDLLKGDLARLWLVERDAGSLRMAAQTRHEDLGPVPMAAAIPVGQGLVGRVVVEKRKLYCADILEDPRFLNREWAAATRLVSMVAVPLIAGDQAVGALAIFAKVSRRFSVEDEELLELFASKAATAVENARLYQEVQQAYEELSHTQDQLTQSQKMEAVGRLAGGIAHDFNNLLTVITGRTELLLQRLGPEDPLHRNIALIGETAQRAAVLTRQLLAFSRKQVLQPKVLDLNTVVAGMEQMLRRLIGEHIGLVTILAPRLGPVRADPGQLEQVVLNLAVNARDAMPQGGRLLLETANVAVGEAFGRQHPGTRPGPHVMLAVSDTGVGMDAETRTHLFEPFFTTKGPGKGTGLGLATVYGIVKQSGGSIEVSSQPGRGARFEIYLPRVDEAPESTDGGAASPELAPGWETILLVEDEAALRDLAREILQLGAYTLLEAGDGAEALRICQQHSGPIHLLVTDVVMPQMSGRELAERLAPLRPDMKVLYMSGYTDDTISHHGILDPDTVLLPKPFSSAALQRKVREVLDSPRPGARRRRPGSPGT